MTFVSNTDCMIIESHAVPVWSKAADVLIVGAGMAGVCAAIEARSTGASVLLVERSGGGTGATAAASGHFYLGGGTPVQTACGFNDSAEQMIRYLEAVALQPDHDKIEAYCRGSVAHFEWLEAQGIPFERSYYPHKDVIQRGTECLIWTGNEQVWPYRELAKPAPRGHKVAFEGEEGGAALALRLLTERAEALGVDTNPYSKVDALVRDNGRIVGVRVQRFGRTLYWRASKAVILAAGGFGQNRQMVETFVPQLASAYIQGGPYDDGLGIQLGIAAGGAVQHMEQAFLTSPFYPPQDLLKGILVNRKGQRFVAEDSYHSRSSIHSLRQPQGEVYLIVDVQIFAYPRFAELTNQHLVDGFETLEQMETGLELPAGALQATLQAYNAHAANGEDPQFHKHPNWLKPLTEGPYAAFDLSWGKAVYTGFTLGGLSVNVRGQVLDDAGQVVPGLYAAGACASNIAQDSNGYASGTCLGEASFFGRCAGRQAAKEYM